MRRRDILFGERFPGRGFTLVELMVSITIIVILAATVLFGMSGVRRTAKVQRTKAQIKRIHELLAERWEAYETRRVAIANTSPQARLAAIRDLIRLEMPETVADVAQGLSAAGGTLSGVPIPTLYRYYFSRADHNGNGRIEPGEWSPTHQGAECLYLILSQITVGDSNALEMFSEMEIADLDGDGMPEILDAFGRPLHFLRWAPGYPGPSTLQTGDSQNDPDPWDPLHVDPEVSFRLFPLVVSAGPDGDTNLVLPDDYPDFSYLSVRNNPFVAAGDDGIPRAFGARKSAQSNGHLDNITNHYLTTGMR